MAKPEAKKGVMVKVIVKTPVTYDNEAYEVDEPLEIDEIHLQQLLDVGAVELVEAAAPGDVSSGAPGADGSGTGNSGANVNQSSDS